MNTVRHVPVMVGRCVELLSPALGKPGAILVDGTLGLGGHSEALLDSCPNATVVGIDRDGEALTAATERLARFGSRFSPCHATYDALPEALASVGAPVADGILLDLGVSSIQIDDETRGFSYARDCPLDMRMDRTSETTAADILASASEEEIAGVLKEYGEERFARRIARSIVASRAETPLKRSAELVDLVRSAIPAAARESGGNPAKRTFQALRIAVNDELGILHRALPQAVSSLRVGGRIVVLSYHSLEDRMVKSVLGAGSSIRAPRGMPVVRDDERPYLRLLTRGAEKASDAEAAANPRSKSVRLRAAERIRDSRGEAA